MKKLILSIFISLIAVNIFSQVNFEWAKQINCVDPEIGDAKSITKDIYGNIYTTGWFNGTADFDPGPGVFNLTSAGSYDIYIQKIDVNGNFIWAKRIGGSSLDEGLSITSDQSGNILVTGSFDNVVDFDPGPNTYNVNGVADVFILNLDTNGNFIWVKSYNGSNGVDKGKSIILDQAGYIYITGDFEGTVDFDPGPNTFNLTTNGGDNGSPDIFVSKLDANGNFVWAKRIGGTSVDYSNSIALDLSGNVYTTGRFIGTVDFDPGPGIFNLAGVASDIFVLKLDANGNFIWAKKMGGTSGDEARSITTDIMGNVYTTGAFQLTADFDPGPNTFNLTSFSGFDMFISKLDANGNFVWAKQIGGYSGENSFDITIDSFSNIYITGDYYGSVDFDPGPNTFTLFNSGQADIFICKLDANGNFIWAKKMGGTSGESAISIIVDPTGNIYTTGSFNATVDFDPGPNTFNLTPGINGDIFIHKLSQCITTTGSNTATACNSYTWNNQNYTQSGQYTFLTANLNGCDNIATLNLTINNSTSSTTNISACNNYTWNNNTYTQSGQYNFLTINSKGCDSTATLNLTINTPPTASITNNNNTTVLTCAQQSISVTAGTGTSYLWSGGNSTTTASNSLSQPGTYTVTVTAANGCTATSSITLTQDISASAANITGVNTICSGDNTTLTASNGSSYLWSNGLTTPSISVNQGGTYSVTVTYANGCTATSGVTLTVNPNTSSTTNHTACNNYTWNSQTYTQSGQYTYLTSNIYGCDSTATLNLTINNSNSSTTNITSCNNYTWNSQTYTQSGQYTFNTLNSKGCDSTATLNLIINNSNSSTTNHTACKSYIWNNQNYTLSGQYTFSSTNANGCDSLAILNLIILDEATSAQSVSICQGNSFSIGDSTYSTAGTYTNVFAAANGCDSIVTTTLTVTDCSGINSDIMSKINLYPNPAKNLVTVAIPAELVNSNYSLIDQAGRTVMTGVLNNLNNSLDISALAKGLYIMQVGEQRLSLKLIKE